MLLLFAAGLVAAPPAGEREAAARRELAALREEIRRLGEGQLALDGERNAAARELREADRALAAAAATVRELDAALDEQQQRLAELQQREAELTTALEAQRDTLASLLRSAHALGRHHQLKLLLSHSDGRRIGRTLGYQRSFQRERQRSIERVLTQLVDLAALQADVAVQRGRLAQARDEQQAAAAALAARRDEQQARLATVNLRFADGRSRLAALGRDEAALLKLIESLADVFADIPRQLAAAVPLVQQRGKLPRPAAGRLRAAFGGAMPDGRGSSGWLIAAEAGAPVRAVAHGRVAFADWMKGYGLLLIVDHGDGYMSLYAGNESLLKDVGDWVQAGEQVAAAGRSGGQDASGLYFELRRNGRPVDPQGWLAR
jgi:murein hydrolase activator